MRLVRTGLVLGVALALVAGATAANALWSARAALQVTATTTGDLAVAAAWQQPVPAWGTLYPGTTTPPSTLNVTATGAGQTLRWHLHASRTVASDFDPYVTMRAWVGACGTGIPLTAAGYSPAAGLTLGQTVPVCIELALAQNAPASLGGKPLNAVITVRADQRGS